MLRKIHNVITAIEIDQLSELLTNANWRDGRDSAGSHARTQKMNEEMDQSCASWTSINNIVVGQLYRHPEFQNSVLPLKVSAAFISRCKQDMHYGIHVDDPIMGAGNAKYRSDVAITVFLSDPSSYDGGELSIHTEFGPLSIKLPAGSAVVYPASSEHQVMPVTRGERVVCALWAQSMVRDAQQRALLSDLDDVRNVLAKTTPNAKVTIKTDQVYMNLLRMWAQL